MNGDAGKDIYKRISFFLLLSSRLVCADPWLLGGLGGFVRIWHLSSNRTLDHSPKDYYYDLNDRRCHMALNDFRKNSTTPCEGYTPRRRCVGC